LANWLNELDIKRITLHSMWYHLFNYLYDVIYLSLTPHALY